MKFLCDQPRDGLVLDVEGEVVYIVIHLLDQQEVEAGVGFLFKKQRSSELCNLSRIPHPCRRPKGRQLLRLCRSRSRWNLFAHLYQD